MFHVFASALYQARGSAQVGRAPSPCWHAQCRDEPGKPLASPRAAPRKRRLHFPVVIRGCP